MIKSRLLIAATFSFIFYLSTTSAKSNSTIMAEFIQAQQGDREVNSSLQFRYDPVLASDDDNNDPRTDPDKFGDNCLALTEQKLTSLTPGNGSESFPSPTSSNRPILWFYIPEVENIKAEFSLLKPDELYLKSFSLSSTDGIIGIQLPPDVLLESTEHSYEWTLTLVCNEYDPAENSYVSGKIRRVEQFLNVENLNIDEQARLFARNGLWHETLTTIITRLYAEDDRLARLRLRELFTAEFVDLENLGNKPVLGVIELPSE
ncbi:MAG: DUF928 domain-containing protein [Spirulinaceae cyanobacterium]